MNFFKEKMLGPLLVAAAIALAGFIAEQVSSGVLIRMLGGIAAGDIVHLHSNTNDRHTLTVMRDQGGFLVVGVKDFNTVAKETDQRWIVRIDSK
jgi:hypothetical protein